GMFAVAIHERESGRVILMRDRLGIKPLYIAETRNGLRFASSLPALVAAGNIDTSIDPIAFQHYMTFHAVVPAPRTILNAIKKMRPATSRVIWADGTSRDSLFWSVSYERSAADVNRSSSDWGDMLLESLKRSVARRMVADVPVGVLLSGGLDSSLVVGLLA